MLFLGNSHLGVMIFFVMSGYIITRILRREMEATATIHLPNFYLRRILKIFPNFYLYLLVVLLLALKGILYVPLARILAAATFSYNYSHLLDHPQLSTRDIWFVGHFWTLCLEEQFYLLWPLVLLKCGLQRGRYTALLIVFLCPFVRVLTYFLWPATRVQLGMMLHTAADPLMVGCLVALGEGSPRLENFVRRLSNGRGAAVAALFAFVVSPLFYERFEGAYQYSVGLTLEACAIAVLLLYLIHYPRSLAGQLFNFKPLVTMGLMSYSVYIWQQLFLFPFNRSWMGGYPLNLLLACGAGALAYFLIEQPILRLKNRLLVRSRGGEMVA